jgi:hypothetical protein
VTSRSHLLQTKAVRRRRKCPSRHRATPNIIYRATPNNTAGREHVSTGSRQAEGCARARVSGNAPRGYLVNGAWASLRRSGKRGGARLATPPCCSPRTGPSSCEGTQ